MSDFISDISFDWTIAKKEADMVIDLQSNWSVDSGDYFYYRVVGHNRYFQNKISPNAEDNLLYCNNKNLLTYVVARNTKELCKALHDPKTGPDINFRIISVKKFTTPIGKGQVTNKYEEIDFCNCPECAEFCIDFDQTISQQCSGAGQSSIESNFLNEIESYGFDINYDSNFDISFDFSSDWTIAKKEADIVVDLNSEWSVQSGKYYYYRVVGHNRYFQNYISPIAEENSLSCNNKNLLTYVAARSTKEVCNSLMNPKLGPKINFKIISIKKFLVPIGEGQVANQYEEIDFCGCPECSELCLDYDFASPAYLECANYKPIKISASHLASNEALSFEHQPIISNLVSGTTKPSISIGGSARLLQYWFPDPNYYNLLLMTEDSFVMASEDDYFFTLEYEVTQIHIFGSSQVISPQRTYTGAGLIQLGSFNIDFIISPLIREANGQIEVSGNSELVSPYWTFNSSGSIGLYSSNTEIKFSINLCLIGKIFVGGGSSEFACYYFLSYNPEGSIFLSGNSESISSYYQYVSSGRILLDGTTSDIVSTNRFYKFQGLLSISGTSGNFGLYSTGGISISGQGEFLYINRLESSGGIQIFGSVSDVVSPSHSYTSVGDLILSQGSSNTNFYNFGTILSVIINQNSVEQTYWNKSDFISSDLSVSTGTVKVCGCSSASLNLNLSHNINNSGVLSDFLKRNKFSLPVSIALKYKKNSNSWIYNQNYNGLGSNGISQEKWQIIFDISCNDDDNNYKYNFYVRRNILNSSRTYYISNLTTNISLDKICSSNQVSTSIILNTDSNIVYIDGISSSSILIDQIGLFKNLYWNNKKDYSLVREGSSNFPVITGIFPEFIINGTFEEDYPTVPLDYREIVTV